LKWIYDESLARTRSCILLHRYYYFLDSIFIITSLLLSYLSCALSLSPLGFVRSKSWGRDSFPSTRAIFLKRLYNCLVRTWEEFKAIHQVDSDCTQAVSFPLHVHRDIICRDMSSCRPISTVSSVVWLEADVNVRYPTPQTS